MVDSSGRRGSARFGRAAACLFAAALALPLLVPAAAWAQTSVKLVGNTGYPSVESGLVGGSYVTGFTTGINDAGYKLTSVDLGFDVDFPGRGNPPVYTVSIWSSNSDRPGSNLGTLANPAAMITGINSFATGTGIDLDARTTYFVVLKITRAGDRQAGVLGTASDDEDAGRAAGWSIADASPSLPS